MAQQALDTFVADIDGSPVLIQKGTVLPDGHPAVKIDKGRGLLFAPFDTGDAAPKRPAAKTAARSGRTLNG